MISFSCVQCGKKFLTPEHLAGRIGKCPRCGERYTIPSADAPMEEASPSAATGEFIAYQDSKDTPLVQFHCPECGKYVEVASVFVGTTSTCAKCGATYQVPRPGEEPVASYPPPPTQTTRPTATPPPAPAHTTKPTASVPAPQLTTHPTPTRTSKPTTAMPSPQFLSVASPQRMSKPTGTMPAAAPSPQKTSRPTEALKAGAAPSSLVEVRSDKPYLRSSAPSESGGKKGIVAALVLCVIAVGSAVWAWKSVAGARVAPGPAAAEPTPPSPEPIAAPSKPTPAPVTHTTPPPEEPVLIPPPDEVAPPVYKDPHPVEPSPLRPEETPTAATPIDPASTAPIVPDAALVEAALADFQRKRNNVKDCPDAVQRARALDALAGVLADPRAIGALGKVLASPEELPIVRQRAAELLGNSRSPEAVPVLAGGFEACRAETKVGRAVIIALGQIDTSASVKALSSIMRAWTKAAHEDSGHLYASLAILSVSQMSQHRREAAEALLGFWASLVEAAPADTSRLSDTEWKRESHRVELERAAQSSLNLLTGKTFATYPEWKAWWQEKGGSFK